MKNIIEFKKSENKKTIYVNCESIDAIGQDKEGTIYGTYILIKGSYIYIEGSAEDAALRVSRVMDPKGNF